LQSLHERFDIASAFRIALQEGHEDPDMSAAVLLRQRQNGPCCRTTNQRNELAPLCMSRKQHIEE
jgi:hypothetical protein